MTIKQDVEIRSMRRALLMCACSFQGSNGIVGAEVAIALGVPHPIRMINLVEQCRREGFDPDDLWPWLRPMVEARGDIL
jgi:hypothetical protein